MLLIDYAVFELDHLLGHSVHVFPSIFNVSETLSHLFLSKRHITHRLILTLMDSVISAT
jgi:hypothetical protein